MTTRGSYVHKPMVKLVIQHLLRRQLCLWWYLQQRRVRVRVMIEFEVQGRVRIKIKIRIRVSVRVGVMFNIRIYHWSNCRRNKCRTFGKLFRGIPKRKEKLLQMFQNSNGFRQNYSQGFLQFIKLYNHNLLENILLFSLFTKTIHWN